MGKYGDHTDMGDYYEYIDLGDSAGTLILLIFIMLLVLGLFSLGGPPKAKD